MQAQSSGLTGCKEEGFESHTATTATDSDIDEEAPGNQPPGELWGEGRWKGASVSFPGNEPTIGRKDFHIVKGHEGSTITVRCPWETGFDPTKKHYVLTAPSHWEVDTTFATDNRTGTYDPKSPPPLTRDLK